MAFTPVFIALESFGFDPGERYRELRLITGKVIKYNLRDSEA